MNTASVLASHRSEHFAGKKYAPYQQEFHTDDDINHNVYIINVGVMEFQMLICSILCFSWSIMLKFCVLLWTSFSKNQMLLIKKNIYILLINWLFCIEFIAFTFDLYSLLSFVCQLYNYYVDQSELLTSFQTDFTSSVWNFCCWCIDGCVCRLYFKQLYAWTIKLEVITMHWFLSVFICI